MSIYSEGLFEILIDWPTPRPHFIIKFNDDANKSSRFSPNEYFQVKLLEDNEKQGLLKIVFNFRQRFNLRKKYILSFHTGNWMDSKAFHAHLCVDLDEYKRVLDETNPDYTKFRPTGNWKIRDGGSIREIYFKNLENYEPLTRNKSQKYKKDDLEVIKNNATKSQRFDLTNFTNLDFTFLNEPKLRINSNSDADYLNDLCNIAESLGLFDRSIKNNGCHICISYESNSATVRSGYLLLAADFFYNILPTNHRETFLKNFERNNQFYIDT